MLTAYLFQKVNSMASTDKRSVDLFVTSPKVKEKVRRGHIKNDSSLHVMWYFCSWKLSAANAK